MNDLNEIFDYLWRVASVVSTIFLILLSPLLIGQILQWTSQGMTHFEITPTKVSAALYVCLMVGAYIKQKKYITYKVTRDTWLLNILIACAIPFTAWNLFTNA